MADSRQKINSDATDFLAKESSAKEEYSVNYRTEVVWRNVVLFSLLHIGGLYGLFCLFFVAQWKTVAWTLLLHAFASFGITAGAHRLWSHRSYKAAFPFRAVLVLLNSIAFQNDIIEWSRDHRCHHKWTETNADPHNSTRGMFFSHIGWLLVKKHPDVIRKGKTLDLSDLYADRLLVWQRRFYPFLVVMLCFLVPTMVPIHFWGEQMHVAFITAALFRYLFSLHVTWCVNSVAHTFGYRPYDISIAPAESLFTALNAFGEGFHNYHHVFPQDYRTSEFRWWQLNPTSALIDLCAKIGLVSDRKTVGQTTIERQKKLHGESSVAG
jgi:stearoyl-CoA desaturase (delta-9 desaturase)